MLTTTTWSFLIPAAFLLVIILLFILIRKKIFFSQMKNVLPHLFILFLLSLARFFATSHSTKLGAQSSTIILIIELLFFFFVMVLSIKIITFFIFDFILGKRKDIRYSRLIKIKDMLVIILYIIGILLIAKYYFHIELTVVAASSAVLTVVAGLALQDILGDLFSGIALNMEESFRLGDWIQVGNNIEGQIEQFRWRSIKIRTLNNTLVVIPNRIASKQEAQRFGDAAEPFAVRLRVGVSYSNSPDSVIACLQSIMRSVPAILKSPDPSVMINEFADFAIVYELKFWLTDYAIKDPIKSEVRRKIWYSFKRENIQIPFPIRDIYIKESKDEQLLKPSEKSSESQTEYLVDLLQQNELFCTINREQLKNLAEGIELKLYGKGEVLIDEGEVGKYFFHILEGEAEVIKENKTLVRLKAGDYVGEMSLFTGEKTVAKVKVGKESKILRISSNKFRETVRMNEKMAWMLSEVIAQRRAELMEFSRQEDLTKSSMIKTESESIFIRIKKYFSL